jgi:hypothetical protein
METNFKPQQMEPGTDQTVPGLALAVPKGHGGEASMPAVGVDGKATTQDAANCTSGLSSPVGEMSGEAGSTAPVSQKRKPHEVLARELGISDKTVREKRKLGMSDEDIAIEAAVNSPKHDPLKFKREVDLPLLEAAVSDTQPEVANGQLRMENLRSRRLSNEQEELKLQKMRGELLSVDQVMDEVVPAFMAVRDGMMAMVEKMAPRLAPISDPAEIRRQMYSEVLGCFDGLEKLIRAGRPGTAAA